MSTRYSIAKIGINFIQAKKGKWGEAFSSIPNSVKKVARNAIDLATTVTGPIPLPHNVALRTAMHMMDGKNIKGMFSSLI